MDMTHVKVIKNMEHYSGPVKTENVCVIYNSARLTEEEARACVFYDQYSPFLIKLPAWQFELIFHNIMP